jgi:YgiT-type zinc finger domain-containing protein
MKGRDSEEVRVVHKYGDCSFCGGEVKDERVELDYRYKGRLYIFQEVPAGVCQQCGEKYLTAKVTKEVERRIQTKEKWEKTVSVPIDIFSEEVAM